MCGNIFLIRNVSPEKYGGGETYQLMLAEKLNKSGFVAYIVSSSQGLLNEARRRKIKTIQAPFIKRQNWSGWRNILFPVYYFEIIRLRKWYKKVFDKYKPSIVNIQSRDDWVAATGVAKKMNIGVLWTDHMDFRSWVLKNINIWYKNLIGKWVLRCAKKADDIIMISDRERKSFDETTAPREFGNVITIKNGVEDRISDYKKIQAAKNSFCYIGRIVDYKGIGELIAAYGAVCEKHFNTKLSIYGNGEDLNRYKELAKENKNIRFYGETDEPLAKMAENEIFVLPSYREGLSLSLLDAAMMGKKIIASDVDGNPEVVIDKKTGLLVPARNAERLAEAMIYMLENKKQAEDMAKNARRLYEEKYNFDKIFTEKMLPLYNIEKEEK